MRTDIASRLCTITLTYMGIACAHIGLDSPSEAAPFYWLSSRFPHQVAFRSGVFGV